MYTGYFGLSELPFSIAPNPDYLFMSDRHREALAHLTYGLGETGGFVLLTGEVGTGKTTISRCLMAQLPENTQTAFILNPTLSSQELLATLCDQLKIRYRKTGATLKTLTDKIQGKLLKNHQTNINTLLIIDEAQHLQAEVLEQLRLLTNFETNTKKLLQVILIGQPELQQLLQRRDLRQLSQRITARYHLMPLNKIEVSQYIQHRLSVANCYRTIFNKKAIRLIYSLSQGIPRLINLLCDRSLWVAYGDSKSVIDKKTVIKASAEALGEEYQPINWWQRKSVKILFSTFMLVVMLGLGVWWGQRDVLFNTVFKLAEKPARAMVVNKAITDGSAKKLTASLAVIDLPKTQRDSKNIANMRGDQIEVLPNEPILSKPPKDETVEQPMANFNVKATAGVSKQLLQSFQSAIDETAEENNKKEHPEDVAQTNFDQVVALTDTPQWLQDALPKMQFAMHLYASDGQGWVRVNGDDVREGENVATGVKLVKILPQRVILNFRGEQFSMAALSSW